MVYEELLATIEDAIMRSQKELTGEHNETSLCIGVKPETEAAAIELGLKEGECASYTGGDSGVAIYKYVGRGCVPLQDLALALVDLYMHNEEKTCYEPAFKDVRAKDIAKSGAVVVSEIRASDTLGEDVWAKIYISACDIAPVNSYAKQSLGAGLAALRDYVAQTAAPGALYVRP